MPFSRAMRTVGKRLLYDVFLGMQRLGLSILPMHFYSPIPDIRSLLKRDDWMAPCSMQGINSSDLGEQLSWLSGLLTALPEGVNNVHSAAVRDNGTDGYGEIEAQVLAAFVARKRPGKVVQVGCGVSTAVILSAARSVGFLPSITCIEPYPTQFLRNRAMDGSIILLDQPAQTVDLRILTDLGPNDLLFIDSTHTVKPGSEVNRLVLEVLTRLVSGTFVHFHDITFPYDYSRELLSCDLFFPGETTLLYAFLLDNPNYHIDLCMSMVHYGAPHELQGLIPRYDPQHNRAGLRIPGGNHFPSSLYLRRLT